jgi:DNA-binding transcriptional MocR family regulator
MTEVLRSGLYDRHLRRLVSEFEFNIRRFRTLILNHFPDGTKVADPQGGFVLWVKLPEGVDAQKVYEESLKAKVSVAPGFIFSTQYKLDRYIRFNAGVVWTSQVVEAIRVVGRIVHQIKLGG